MADAIPYFGHGPHHYQRIKLNVGGKLFETTLSTVRSGGPDSVLQALSGRAAGDSQPAFIDRDPEIFSVLLSVLRSNRIPSTADRRFSKQELTDEAVYYGIESPLRSAMSPPPLSGIDAALVATVRPSSDALPSALTADDDGSLWIAHGGQISAYDSYLTHAGTIRTHIDHVNSIRRVWPDAAAVGSSISAGLHIYEISGGRHVASAQWIDPADPRLHGSLVSAITDSASSIYASFKCLHKENSILAIDKSTLQVASEIGRQSGKSAKTMAAGKLKYIPTSNIVVGSAVTATLGCSGYIRLWDARSTDVIWETIEPGSGLSCRNGDLFADVDISSQGTTMFKICSISGEIAVGKI